MPTAQIVIKDDGLLSHVHSILTAAEAAFIEGMQQSNQMHRIFTQTAGGNAAKCSEIRKSEHVVMCLYVAQTLYISL